MDDTEQQQALNEFETRMLEGKDVEARGALRALLFGLADAPISGSVADAVHLLADYSRPPPSAASRDRTWTSFTT